MGVATPLPAVVVGEAVVSDVVVGGVVVVAPRMPTQTYTFA